MAIIVPSTWNYDTKTWHTDTQKQWDREIGWGKVPEKYKSDVELTHSDHIDRMIKGHNS